LTTGLWAVEKICTVGEAAAQDDKWPILKGACDKLAPYFALRNLGIGSTVHAEMLQAAEDTDIPKPPNAYTANQYEDVVGLYLRTAYIAKHFPHITTHYFLDADAGSHYDPRCFNLDKLYADIAETMKHPAGCIYGVEPSYGKNRGKDKVWWDDSICGKRPSAK